MLQNALQSSILNMSIWDNLILTYVTNNLNLFIAFTKKIVVVLRQHGYHFLGNKPFSKLKLFQILFMKTCISQFENNLEESMITYINRTPYARKIYPRTTVCLLFLSFQHFSDVWQYSFDVVWFIMSEGCFWEMV